MNRDVMDSGAPPTPQAPAQGAYLGAPALVYWGRVASLPAICALFCGLAPRLLSARTGTPVPGEALWVFALFGLASGIVLAPVVWLASARHASLVKWNEEDVTVTWYRGPARHYRWEELARLRTGRAATKGGTIQIGERGNYATVRTVTGQNWTIWEGKGGYVELLGALKAHLEAPGEGRDPAPR
jgi:hypothetical protein